MNSPIDFPGKINTAPGSACSFCGETGLKSIIDFGDVALAGGFLKKEDFASEQKYPLLVCFCPRCYVVQVAEKIDREILFAHDFYFSSAIKTLRDHFTEYASDVTSRFLSEPKKSVVVEVGCNDGVLLRPLADQGIGTVIGVDPATNITETITDPRLTVINDFFGEPVAKDMIEKYGKADLVVANNVYAHIADINGLTAGIVEVLKDDGVFIFEVHYLGKIMEELQYDMIYHEHMYYYSLLALENHFSRHGMVIFDIKSIPIHGGSMRFYVGKEEGRYSKQIDPSVTALRESELKLGYDKFETYKKFASACLDRKTKLMDLIAQLRVRGKTIAGYGASGRANTMIQYCGINESHLEYMVDDAPAKQGFYTPGSHLLIKNSAILKDEPPDYILVFAWTFFNEIAAKCQDYLTKGGHFIIPLPEVRVTPSPSSTEIS